MAREKKYTAEVIAAIRGKLEKYIKKTYIPIVAEFAYQNNIPRQKLYELQGIRDTIKKLIDKKEAQLERGGLEKKVDKTMAIFSLKQLGWKDTQEIELGDSAQQIAKDFAALVSPAGTGQATSGH